MTITEAASQAARHRNHGMNGGWCYLSDTGLETP